MILSNNDIGGMLSYENISDSVANLILSLNKIYGDIFLSNRLTDLNILNLSYNLFNGTVDWNSFLNLNDHDTQEICIFEQ